MCLAFVRANPSLPFLLRLFFSRHSLDQKWQAFREPFEGLKGADNPFVSLNSVPGYRVSSDHGVPNPLDGQDRQNHVAPRTDAEQVGSRPLTGQECLCIGSRQYL